MAKLEIKLPKATLDKVRAYYLMEQTLINAADMTISIIGAATK